MTALLIADHDNVKLRPATASAVTALLQMTEAVDVLVAGNGCEAVAEEAAKIAGVRTVLLAQNAKLAQELPEVLAYTAAHEARRRLAKRPCPAWRLSLTVLRSPMLLP